MDTDSLSLMGLLPAFEPKRVIETSGAAVAAAASVAGAIPPSEAAAVLMVTLYPWGCLEGCVGLKTELGNDRWESGGSWASSFVPPARERWKLSPVALQYTSRYSGLPKTPTLQRKKGEKLYQTEIEVIL